MARYTSPALRQDREARQAREAADRAAAIQRGRELLAGDRARLQFSGSFGGRRGSGPRQDTISRPPGTPAPKGYEAVGRSWSAASGSSILYARRTLSASLEA